MDITSLQRARAIIDTVGEPHQALVIYKLRSLTYNSTNNEEHRKAKNVIANMEKEYALNVANVLIKDKFDQIPDYLKE
ncbi:hypothetical protein HZI73_22435 [Vallitalea pronyensis]|uniref:Uncharacterized protein n=1 Tax=Vallitalea pronyensis TaxID=1348613 RepID=A0A8J8MPA0_9FIRM|nr:hypothetical protein [Vallitalea pronyensis]QUI24888.1 hypothetical protein HZI73_22435 [Vallitalea pronyensis]